MFLRDQVVKKGIIERVFAVNDHYLIHICYITEMLDFMKAYSTRSTKRTIKKFSNLIAEKTKTGTNTSNLLLKLTIYDSNLIEQLKEDKRRLGMADTYDSTLCLAFRQVVKMLHKHESL
jgi:phenolic acid decarboxylase